MNFDNPMAFDPGRFAPGKPRYVCCYCYQLFCFLCPDQVHILIYHLVLVIECALEEYLLWYVIILDLLTLFTAHVCASLFTD